MGQDPEKYVCISYTNHAGIVSERIIEPLQLWFGATEWHPVKQWMLKAWDVKKKVWRDFAIKDMKVTTEEAAKRDSVLEKELEFFNEKKADLLQMFPNEWAVIYNNPNSGMTALIYSTRENALRAVYHIVGVHQSFLIKQIVEKEPVHRA